jgi:hypothetical protein
MGAGQCRGSPADAIAAFQKRVGASAIDHDAR